MNSKFTKFILSLCIALVSLSGCDIFKSEDEYYLPELQTMLIKTTLNTASCECTITYDGQDSITKKGICWATKENPSVDDFKAEFGSGKAKFSCEIKGLSSNTTYYARAYATNRAGTGYGKTIVIKTRHSILTDIDGNTYYTVKIGEQIWMAENLKVTHFRNGEPIPFISNNDEWYSFSSLKKGCWCYPENSAENNEVYGKFYNFFALTDSRNICPTGWHVPTKDEWTKLVASVGGSSIAGVKMKEANNTRWGQSDMVADNSSGFTGIPSGSRLFNGLFNGISIMEGNWWSATETMSVYGYAPEAFAIRLGNGNENIIYQEHTPEGDGYCVRCIKD